MKALILYTKKTSSVTELAEAFLEKGFEKAEILDIKKLSLYSDNKETKVKGKSGIKNFDCIILKTGTELTEFIEPLIEELEDLPAYFQAKKNSYYINSNEILRWTILNTKNVKVPDTYIFGQADRIKEIADAIDYPVVFKAFSKGKKTQSIIAETPRSLKSIAGSILSDIDAIIVRELIEGSVDHCIVIGNKVYAITRELKDEELRPLKKGTITKLSKTDTEMALHAAHVSGLEIATVKMCRGFVLSVDPKVALLTFTKKFGDSMFEEVASFFAEKIKKRKK